MKKIDITLINRARIPGRNSIEEIFDSLLPILQINKTIEIPHSKLTLVSFLKNLYYAKKNKGTINHITGDVHYLCLVTGMKTILTVHDVQSILKGNVLRKYILRILWFWIPAMLVSKITVISEFSKQELLKIIPFADNKIKVIPNPVSEIFTFEEKVFNKAQPNILHIGTKENKNLTRVIEALSKINSHLTILGPIDEEIKFLLRKKNIAFSNFYNLTFNEVVDLYKSCDIVSFPSLYEGFGMPIIEGNKVGRAVLTSNICSMPEVAANAACLVNPFSVEDIRRGFNKIINDKKYREELISNGRKNVSRYDINNIAKEYNNLYSQLMWK